MSTHRSLLQGSLVAFLLFTGLLTLAWVAYQPDTIPVDSIAEEPYYQDQDLLEQAWANPVASSYKPGFEYQINWAFCGPATVVNLFRSLGIDGHTQENIFDNAEVSYWKARFLGLTLDELAELIEANGNQPVEVVRDLSLEEFRAELRKTNDPAYRYLINFSRGPLFGVVIGHHSPIGGYLEDQDLVFVLDVLDEYKPFLVPTERLYEAMDTVDSETEQKRGLLRVNALPQTAIQLILEKSWVTR
jgi:hypothetical protein